MLPWQSGLICSHKIVQGRQFELCSPRTPQGPDERGNIRSNSTVHTHDVTGRSVREGQHQQWDGLKPAWGYASYGEPCFGQLVVAVIKYDFVGTDETTLPRKNIYASD